MSANTLGQNFRVTTFGESHGGAVGCVIDGCPAGIEISTDEIEKELKRRATGQSKITSQRKESDKVEILSGTFEGKTIGTPITLLVKNKDAKSSDYEYLKDKYRPSHADFTYDKKYGFRAWAGGGRASARETTARVMAGVIAKKILKNLCKVEVLAYVVQVGTQKAQIDSNKVNFEDIEKNIVRCPDDETAKKMISLIEETKKQGDSVGGVVECVVKNPPIGLGEPVFDKLSADLAHACMSISATKGFEIGSGFAGSQMKGSEHNDSFCLNNEGKVCTRTNNSGGIQGGISNGESIVLRTAFKPTSTILKTQNTLNDKNQEIIIENIKGRHDPCVVPRAVVIVEAMVSLVLVDHYMRNTAQNKLFV